MGQNVKWLIFVVLAITSPLTYADRISDLQESVDQLQDELIDQQMLRMIRERNRSNALANHKEQVSSFEYKKLGEMSV